MIIEQELKDQQNQIQLKNIRIEELNKTNENLLKKLKESEILQEFTVFFYQIDKRAVLALIIEFVENYKNSEKRIFNLKKLNEIFNFNSTIQTKLGLTLQEENQEYQGNQSPKKLADQFIDFLNRDDEG